MFVLAQSDFDDIVKEVFSNIDDPSMDCACCKKKELVMLLNHLNEHSPQCKWMHVIKARIERLDDQIKYELQISAT